MRERLQLLLFLLLGSLTWGNAQTNVTLNINHLLGEEPFRLSTTAQNNLGQAFNFSRLEYYLAEISLIHDQGSVGDEEGLSHFEHRMILEQTN